MDDNVIKKIKELDILIGRNIIKEKMPPTQMAIIGYLVNHKSEVVYQSDLEKVFQFRRSTLSGILDTMEKRELIKRVSSNSDGRKKQIVLTEKTIERYSLMRKRIDLLSSKMIQGIDSEDLNIFYSVIDKIKNNIKENNND